MIQAVVDPAVLVRSLLSPAGGNDFLIEALREKRFLLLTSERYLNAVARLLEYPGLQLKYGMPASVRQNIQAQIAARAVNLTPVGTLQLCPNPDDNHLMEIALVGHAEYVVTDNDAVHADQSLTWFLIERSTRAIRMAEFARILRAEA